MLPFSLPHLDKRSRPPAQFSAGFRIQSGTGAVKGPSWSLGSARRTKELRARLARALLLVGASPCSSPPGTAPTPLPLPGKRGGKRRGRAGSSRGLPSVNSPRRLKPVLGGKVRPEPRSRSAARTPQEGALGPLLARLPSSPSSSPSSSGSGSRDKAPQPPAPHGHPGGVPLSPGPPALPLRRPRCLPGDPTEVPC